MLRSILAGFLATGIAVVAHAQDLNVARGAAEFQSACLRCHVPLEMTTRIINDWVGRSAEELYDQVSKTMPGENPGSLSTQQYLDITAFLLKTGRVPVPENLDRSMLASLHIAPAEAEAVGESFDWTHIHGSEASTRYVPLDQINADNVNSLEVAWLFDTGSFGPSPESTYLSTPIMVNGTLYATAGVTRNIIALDPETAQLKWMWRPQEGQRFSDAPRKGSGKGLSYYENGGQETIFTVTPGYYLVALNAKNGLPRTEFGAGGIIDLQQGLRLSVDMERIDIGISFPPLVVEDVVIVGAAHTNGRAPTSASNVKGDVRAFDANTGELLWTFRTIPELGESGFESWITGADITGNAGVWAAMSADPDLDLVYIPVEAPTGDWYGGHRHGNNLYSSSIVAMNYRTGEIVWHFQHAHHDIWDYDTPSAPVLADLPDGTPAVIQMLKQAHLLAFNRETGEPLFPIEERPVPLTDVPGEWSSPVQPFPTKPAPYDRQGFQEEDLVDFTPEILALAKEIASDYRYSELYTPPSLYNDPVDGTLGTLHMPAPLGGSNWEGSAYDPETGLIYIPSRAAADVMALVNEPEKSNMNFIGAAASVPSIDGLPLIKPPYGRVTAIDLVSGEHVWMKVNGDTPDEVKNHPLMEGVEIPATGKPTRSTLLLTKTLLFQGEGSRGAEGMWVRDKATGEVIAHLDLPGVVSGMPMSYMLDGKQYIVAALSVPNSTAKLIALRLPE